jgi:hypothetical protein
MAYARLEPFGEERADLRMAVLAALIANANRDPAKKREPFTPEDFRLRFDEQPEGREQPIEMKQDWQQQKAIMQSLMRQKIASARKDAPRNDGS